MRARTTLVLVIAGLLTTSACNLLSGEDGKPAAAGRTRDPVGPVLVIGIDGATFDRIHPLVEQGRLPVLGRLLETGVHAPLETLEPTVSPAIWTTIATGTLPEVHGILGFQGVPGQTMETLPTSQMRRVRAFWNILSEHDRSVGVIGWWASWPAERIEGYVVSDRVAYTRMEATLGTDRKRPGEIYPEDLAAGVREHVREPNEITADQVRRFMDLNDVEVQRLLLGADYEHGHFLPEFKYVHQSDRSTVDIAKHLMGVREVGVTAVALYGVDTVSHLTWHWSAPEDFPNLPADVMDERFVAKFGQIIDRYYEYTDGLLGELIDAAGPETSVVVFSDHGFGPTGNLPWSGGHGRITPGAPIAPDGILIASGPAFRSGVALERTHVLDLAPTLLYLQGLPTAEDMPGTVLTGMLREDVVADRPVDTVPTYETYPLPRDEEFLSDAELDAAVRAKLEALGYLEDSQPKKSEPED